MNSRLRELKGQKNWLPFCVAVASEYATFLHVPVLMMDCGYTAHLNK